MQEVCDLWIWPPINNSCFGLISVIWCWEYPEDHLNISGSSKDFFRTPGFRSQFGRSKLSENADSEELQIWPALWSRTHGPVYSLEPDATVAAIENWRNMIRVTKPTNATSILNSMKTHQTAFNGSGAQEATDQLFVALIHPLMPARFVCQNDDLFDRLLDAVISYDKSRNDLLTPSLLPYVSGKKPIYMNHSGHTIYMRNVLCFKRTDVIFNAQRLQKAHELNLFQPNAIMQPDGRGVGETLWSAVFCITGESNLKAYSPFTARPDSSWHAATRETVGTDILHDVNSTTIGETAGRSSRNRPTANEIRRHETAKKQRVSIDTEKENIDTAQGIMTRSHRKLLESSRAELNPAITLTVAQVYIRDSQ
ncbi:hypothetical protein B0H14DRAFT_2587489 [Mycena olivaceomarginata]|nr:hypothetical protein B0H14DRAFT_2587489 [Mycena olivaceomarginata]